MMKDILKYKKNRRYFCYILFLLCGTCLLGNVSAAESPQKDTATFIELQLGRNTFYIDGDPGQLTVAPFIENNRTLVPLKAVAEALNCEVEWEPIKRQIRISRNMQEIILTVGSSTAQITEENISKDVALETAPIIVNSNTVVPLRFVAENLDCQVLWDSNERKIVIAAMAPGGQEIGADTMISYLQENQKENNGIIVAVIDSGVEKEHMYLKDRIVYPYNIVQKNDDITDKSGHGTKVAGVIANCTMETVKIMPIKVDDEYGMYTPEAIAEAIRYAVEKNAGVINISLSSATTRNNKIITEAIDEAVRKGCPVVVAAGNQKDDVAGYSPANTESAIVVTAVNQHNELWSNSNYGSTITLAAPGVDVVTSDLKNTYITKDGTSMAAPYVTAAVAMLRTDIPGITPEEIRNVLIRYAKDLGEPGWDPWYGNGLIDLEQYVKNRKNGMIEDFTQSTKEKIALLEKEIKELYKQALEEHQKLYGAFFQSFFATQLAGHANSFYEIGDYFAAGYYLEEALKYDSYHNASKNNLAYLIRRGEYVSYQYRLQKLLDQAKAGGLSEAFINDALAKAAKNQWEEADAVMAEFCGKYQGTLGMKTVIETWKRYSYQNDAEGDLVLGWLMRYHQYEDDTKTQQEYMKGAMRKYPALPDWLKEPVLNNG